MKTCFQGNKSDIADESTITVTGHSLLSRISAAESGFFSDEISLKKEQSLTKPPSPKKKRKEGKSYKIMSTKRSI